MGRVGSSCARLPGEIPPLPARALGTGTAVTGPGNAEQLWVCSAAPTRLGLEEKLSRWGSSSHSPGSRQSSQEMEELPRRSRLDARALRCNLIFQDSCSQ